MPEVCMKPNALWPLALSVAITGCSATSGTTGSASGSVRTYYVAADEMTWDYIPGGVDQIAGKPFTPTGFFKAAPNDLTPIGKPKPVPSTYTKSLYREYTDSTFKTLKPRPPEWQHLGFLGPVIHGVVG